MDVRLPGQPGYEAATAVFNLTAPATPAAAAEVSTVDEIRAALDYARAFRLGVRMHTTGHASPTQRPMDDALLVKVRPSGPVEVDVARRVARVPAGTLWGAVAEAAAPFGLAAPHGSSGTVGVVGYLLRGGMSYYGRQLGVATNLVRAVELVTADGSLVRASAAENPELFWAVRGGGGGFGVVTALEVELFPAAKVITGSAFWAGSHADRLLAEWLRWSADAPWEATTSLQLMNLPELPEIPEVLRSGPVLSVDGAVLAVTEDGVGRAQEQADELLGRLRAVAEPVMDSWALTKPSAVLEAHMDPEDPVPIAGDHLLLRDLDAAGAAEFLRVVGPESGSPFISAGMRQLGGAYSVADPAGGALSSFAGRFAYSGAGLVVDEASREAVESHCALVRSALAPWDSGWTVPSFVENWQQPQRHLSDSAIARVDAVRSAVDPTGVFAGDISPGATAR
ncbi:FAD-binding oxidoreductase [Amycolatopsis albispora]|uniref:Oxidoreductase n=1 Tax=Amycolatopsis albispora TaxID=1804986 RepID=A0A344LH61_9PSEU|nr:FAD-binding protein [Amycolatopsis albispora]AXB47385.1 oxidoreductase [Amycolatopsis albispora]